LTFSYFIRFLAVKILPLNIERLDNFCQLLVINELMFSHFPLQSERSSGIYKYFIVENETAKFM